MNKNKRKIILNKTIKELIIGFCIFIIIFIISHSLSVSMLIGVVYFLYSLRILITDYLKIRREQDI